MGSRHDALETPVSTAYSPQDDDLTTQESAAALPQGSIRIVNYPRVILFVAGVFLAFKFFDAITRALVLFFLAFLIAIALNAPVRWLEAHGVKRGLSVAGVALILLSAIGTAGYFGGPRLAEEVASLMQAAPQNIERLENRLRSITQEYPTLDRFIDAKQIRPENLIEYGRPLLPRLGRYTLNFFSALVAGVFVLVAALYTLGTPRPLIKGLLSAVPPGHRVVVTRALTRIVGQLESWVVATLLLMLIVGVACGLGLWLIGVPNAFLFGVLAGIGEGVPTIGPIITAIPPIIVALADDPTKALWVAGLFLVVQQLENNVLVPIIMARNLNLHPVSVLFFVLALGALLGIVGALLAVPVAIIVKVFFEEFYEKRRAPKEDALDAAADQIVRAGSRPDKSAAAPSSSDDNNPPPSGPPANDSAARSVVITAPPPQS